MDTMGNIDEPVMLPLPMKRHLLLGIQVDGRGSCIRLSSTSSIRLGSKSSLRLSSVSSLRLNSVSSLRLNSMSRIIFRIISLVHRACRIGRHLKSTLWALFQACLYTWTFRLGFMDTLIDHGQLNKTYAQESLNMS